MSTSKATATWDGTIKAGKGVMKPEHGAETPFSFGTRFEGQTGSNPEELVGAALAGCFSMALSSNLEKAGAKPQSIRTSADVKLEKGSEGFTITTIQIDTHVVATGIEDAKFQEVAAATKKGCPVSRALAGVGSIQLNAVLAAG